MAVNVLICDPVSDSAVAALRETPGVFVDVQDAITLEELAQVIGNYDAIVVRSRTKVREPLIDAGLPRLKAIIRGGVGLDSIDVDYARDKGVMVLNTPRASSNAVAELALALMFALVRHVPRADATMKAGAWEKKRLKGTELLGKTLGIIGYGRIGQLLGMKAKALGMKVLAHDPYVEHEDVVTMDELLRNSDFVSLHLPHVDATHHLIDAGQIKKMKGGAYIIQASRGGTVNEKAVHDAIVSGHLAGAAFDVYTEEPPHAEDIRALIELPQVVATPHIGAATVDSQDRIGGEIVALVREHLL